MHYYGILLEDFNNNGEFVNDCIFTMMHHIGGDLGQIGVLFQPIILKTYSRIWEADYELCDVCAGIGLILSGIVISSLSTCRTGPILSSMSYTSS